MDRLKSITPRTTDEFTADEIAYENRRRAGATAALAAELGSRYSPSLARLDTYRVYHANQKPVLAAMRELLADQEAATKTTSLILFGSYGTGKDHLAAALLYEVISQYGTACRWVNGRNLFGASRDAISLERAEETVIGPLVEPGIVCVSDVLPIAGDLSPWQLDLFYRILDARYRRSAPTWLTVNVASEDDARKRFTPAIWERLYEHAIILPCFWPSYRTKANG